MKLGASRIVRYEVMFLHNVNNLTEQNMVAELDDLNWHDGVIRGLVQVLPETKQATSIVRLSASLWKDQSDCVRCSFLLTFSGVVRISQIVDTVELRDNSVAGNIIHAYWSKKKTKAQHFIMQLYDGYIEIVFKDVSVTQQSEAAKSD